MRPLTTSLEAAIANPEAALVWLVELAEGTNTAATLTRIHDGLVADLQTSSLSDLSAFTVVSGSWQLQGGKIEGASAADGVLRWDTPGDIGTGVFQVKHDVRSVGSIFPAAGVGMSTGGSPTYSGLPIIIKYVQQLGSTSPPGVENQDTVLRLAPVGPIGTLGIILDTDLSQHANHPMIITGQGRSGELEAYAYKGNPGPTGFGYLYGGLTTFTSGAPFLAVANNNGLFTYPNGPIKFTRLSVYENYSVTVIGIPAGYSAAMQGPQNGSGFDDPEVGGSLAGGTGWSVIDAAGRSYPYTTVVVKDSLGTVVATITPSGGVWGGDIYQFNGGEPVPIVNITSARDDVTFDGKLFVAQKAPAGEDDADALEAGLFDAIRETPDWRSQGMNFGFSAVDPTAILDALKASRFRGGVVRVWLGVWNNALGGLENLEAQLVFRGYAQRGLEVRERWPEFDGGNGTAEVQTRVSSRFAEKERSTGIRTSDRRHSQISPHDTFFRYVQATKGVALRWG